MVTLGLLGLIHRGFVTTFESPFQDNIPLAELLVKSGADAAGAEKNRSSRNLLRLWGKICEYDVVNLLDDVSDVLKISDFQTSVHIKDKAKGKDDTCKACWLKHAIPFICSTILDFVYMISAHFKNGD